ncbi:hypothetical protein [Robiginitalea sp. SC105]|uniref:hypothetical protein n=1 Tax=Robiginitalea sp. SC105 TaxID=2762332 RepID=UPI00163A1163|nr:hypothetical protein [Robiginitalea sp. SC105]MBC2838571.1 hypothetical protein [Robiginitalea sp. SC105]
MTSEKMSFNATWSMAVGGMVGGGIFSVPGVIIRVCSVTGFRNLSGQDPLD